MKNQKITTSETNEYFSYLHDWIEGLTTYIAEPTELSTDQVAIMVVDMVNGFCNEGALASARVKGIIDPIVTFLQSAWDHGIRNYLLVNDFHEIDAVEFQSFPSHCVKGSIESQPVNEIKSLPFYSEFTIITKNSLSADLEKQLKRPGQKGSNLTCFIIVGNCTDLCVYQAAMSLRLKANAKQEHQRQVIVPIDCVETYDLDLRTAEKIGVVPHPARIMNAMFLHHMALNGIRIVKQVSFNKFASNLLLI